jgi:hypothetical protein
MLIYLSKPKRSKVVFSAIASILNKDKSDKLE